MSLFRKKIFTENSESDHGDSGLKRVLTLRDLTFMGIAAIIGAGSFSALGAACFSAGPGVVVMFAICAIACGFTALCYAEFASRIPVAGSAYTYAYASFGEIIAWVIGWALILEYSVGNIYVAFSWSDYFTGFLSHLHIQLPTWLTTSHMEAKGAFLQNPLAKSENVLAWTKAPMIAGLKIIFDLPALVINILITWLVFVGVKESKRASNIMVIIKLTALALVILVGIYYIIPANWFPESEIIKGTRSFMPKGFNGVMAAVSGVFFAFVGFDALSTMSEEAKNPQKDLPRAMIYSLIICTCVYIVLALVLTGMVDYKKFEDVGDPLAEVFKLRGVDWLDVIISICAVVAMTSVILVFQLGQPRIWYTMSKDGLLPKKFAKIHPKYRTPSFSTIATGLVVGIPLFFVDRQFVLDFTSIGTLFAFVLVCGGVLLLPKKVKVLGKFHLKYINGKFLFFGIMGTILLGILLNYPNHFGYLLNRVSAKGSDFTLSLSTLIFWFFVAVLSLVSFIKNWSLIPLLGLTSCLYLLTGMSAMNWFWFLVWFAIGLIIYFLYSRKNSVLNLK